jgi:hypothetical protein
MPKILATTSSFSTIFSCFSPFVYFEEPNDLFLIDSMYSGIHFLHKDLSPIKIIGSGKCFSQYEYIKLYY